jgi:hypothetical protein
VRNEENLADSLATRDDNSLEDYLTDGSDNGRECDEVPTLEPPHGDFSFRRFSRAIRIERLSIALWLFSLGL